MNFKDKCLGALIAFAFIGPPVMAAEPAGFPPIPSTISTQAQVSLAAFQQIIQGMPPFPTPGPEDVEAWGRAQETFIQMNAPGRMRLLDKYQFTQTARTISGVPVIEVTPANLQNKRTVLVYVHGGGYVFGTAASSLPSAVMAAHATRMRVISIDYTVAPKGKWREATDQVISVLRGLQTEGYPLTSVAIFGDSAGGGLASGAVLKMRDKGYGMPAAVVLWSPWSDITDAGDTYASLKDADFLSYPVLAAGAAAYAPPSEQKNAYVSPVYGDYTKGYPPTLIQGGTREILLSGFIRHYQAIDNAGQTVKLDLYEGMPHVFQYIVAGTPEADLALVKMERHLRKYLRLGTPRP